MFLKSYFYSYFSNLDKDEIFMKKEFVNFIMENQETEVLLGDTTPFDGGNILKVGGDFGNKYAIVSH